MTKLFPLALLVALASCQAPLRNAAHAQQQTVIRDAGGRTIGTATTDSQGTTVFRDAGGRTSGTASPSDQGSAGHTTTFRDAGGRTTGTLTAPPRSNR
jgi:hypothetical protein